MCSIIHDEERTDHEKSLVYINYPLVLLACSGFNAFSFTLSVSLSLTSSIKASLSESHTYQKENIKGGAFLFVEKKLNYQATTLLRHAFNLLGTVVGCCSESQTLNRYKSLL